MEIIIDNSNLRTNALTAKKISREAVREMNRTATLVLNKIAEIYAISPDAEVGLIWADDAYIKDLNWQYRAINAPTDVLSFALNDEPGGLDGKDAPQILTANTGLDISKQETLLGDIVISIETAAVQAAEYGHSFTREIAFLTTHGMLHLLGYDHEKEEDMAEMRQEEEYILSLLEIGR